MNDERVTAEELVEIRRLDKKATPGPWEAHVHGRCDATVRHAPRRSTDASGEPVCWFGANVTNADNDARFVAFARALLPKLVAERDAIDRALSECGIDPRDPDDTILARLTRLIADTNKEAERVAEQDVDRCHDLLSMAEIADGALWERVEDLVERDEHTRDEVRACRETLAAERSAREALREKARAVWYWIDRQRPTIAPVLSPASEEALAALLAEVEKP